MKEFMYSFLILSLVMQTVTDAKKISLPATKSGTTDSSQYYYKLLKKEFTSHSVSANLSRTCLSKSVHDEIDNMIKGAGKKLAESHPKAEDIGKAIFNLDQFVDKLKNYTWEKGYNAAMPLPLEKYDQFSAGLCPLWPFC